MDTKLMNAIEAASGSNAKVALLKTADERTKRFLVYALDTYITFGATLKKVPTISGVQMEHDEWWLKLDGLLHTLSQRGLTGNAARDTIDYLFQCAPTQDDAKWGAKVLNKNLRCGVSQSSLLKAFPGIIKPFAVSLAKQYDPAKSKLGRGYVEPKLDGLRCVVIDGVAYTRNGREIENAGKIIEELGELTKDWVFDGELLDPNVSFEETISKARGSKGHDGLEYHVFDVVKRSQWFEGKTFPYEERRDDLENLIFIDGDWEHVKVVEATRLDFPTQGQLMDICDEYMEQGYEGAMFKDADASYCFKRSDAILKVKKFETHDAAVVEAQEGRGKYKGMLGALVVEGVGNVGSGFSDAERKELWERRESLPGQMVEVKFQNKTAHGKDRFPTFIRFRPDKE